MYFSSLSSCSVSPPEDKTWVEIQHNNTEMTRVLFSSEKNQHFAHFNYSSAEEQLAAIISQSEHCEQELSYHCRRSRLLSSIGKILKFNLFLLLFTRFYFWFFFLTTVLMYLKRIVSLSEHKGSFSASVESKETRANSVKNWTSVVNNLPFLKQKVLPKGFHHNFFVCFKISKFAILKSDETEILKRTIFQRIIKSCCKKSPMLCLPACFKTVLLWAGGREVQVQVRSRHTGEELRLTAISVHVLCRESVWIQDSPATVMPTTTNGTALYKTFVLLRLSQKH